MRSLGGYVGSAGCGNYHLIGLDVVLEFGQFVVCCLFLACV